jgi:arginine decarboxylase
MNRRNAADWSSEDSANLYGIRQWGGGNFDLSAQGEVTVKVNFPTGEVTVPLTDIVAGAGERGHNFPLLLRIENLLDARLALLNESFAAAIAENNYQGIYQGVFPVKVNQQAPVIEEISRFGAVYNQGLEAGSKPELLLALANLNDGGLLICNGYKDREFIDLGLWANKLGYRCFFVIESPTELPLILQRSALLGIAPLIGVRIKVSAKVGGLWTETSGDRSSFGLSTAQLVAVVDQLRESGRLDCLQLLHCHLGSQIPDIEEIRAGVREASRFYADLASEGVPLKYLDLGGGLAVDYIGNQSKHSHSRNYTLADYCRCLVATVAQTLAPQQVAHPILVTESGRATVAHTTMLFFNILDILEFQPLSLPRQCPAASPDLVARQFELHKQPDLADLVATYQEALDNRDQIREHFRNGDITLRQRSLAENLFLSIARQVEKELAESEQIPAELQGLRHSLADIYYGNFSVFQSLPDTWAIGQVFPVMPISRLNEAPVRDAIISDLTCDCDGKLDNFILAGGEQRTLPLHPLREYEDYILGVFLMGAYQETLGDLHNLFGDTNVVSVRINADGSVDVNKELAGDSVADVLSMVQYNPKELREKFRITAEHAVRNKLISITERQQILQEFADQLQGYTYYES